ncbi:hypothetical protein J7K86_00960 [bacterium]|nr:hypothetical protein [bacterium]
MLKKEEINAIRTIIDPILLKIKGVVLVKTAVDQKGAYLLIGIEKRRPFLEYRIKRIMGFYSPLRYKIKVVGKTTSL